MRGPFSALFNGNGGSGDDSQALVGGAHVFANRGEARPEPHSAENAGDAANDDGVRRADCVSQSAG